MCRPWFYAWTLESWPWIKHGVLNALQTAGHEQVNLSDDKCNVRIYKYFHKSYVSKCESVKENQAEETGAVDEKTLENKLTQLADAFKSFVASKSVPTIDVTPEGSKHALSEKR